jgi:hypothetical protein
MSAIHPGDIWKLAIDNQVRRMKVVAAAGTPGWWRCVDLETDISFLAREAWFVERERAGEQLQ